MFDYNVELAIKELFLFDYVIGDAFNMQAVFELLCDIYCVGEGEQKEIISLLDNNRLNSIHTISDYYRESRIRQYYQNFCGGYFVDDERIEELIAVKGAVFEFAQRDKLLSAYEKTSGRSYDELVRLASTGVVSAKRLLGILQMEGIYITQDINVGFENIQDAADWLDIPALVTTIYYCDSSRQEFLDKLYSITQKTDYAVIVEQLQIQYSIESCAVSETAKSLEKAFEIGTAKRELCSSQHLRIIRSNVLSEDDKRTVLLSGNKELVPAVCGLPLQLEYKKININREASAVLKSDAEMAAIMSSLENNDLRNRDFFRSLCITSNSEYVREAYVDWIYRIFSESNVVLIDVASLLPIDLDATENNVFIRNCHEKDDNVYIVKLSGKIDERIVNLVKKIATSIGRKAFAITHFGISIDLCSALPIYICDRRNSQLLEGNVRIVNAANISESEKILALENILRKKQVDFSVGEITMEDSAKDILLNAPINKISDILDQIILTQRRDNKPIHLMTEIVQEYIGAKLSHNTYGFGGTHAKK